MGVCRPEADWSLRRNRPKKSGHATEPDCRLLSDKAVVDLGPQTRRVSDARTERGITLRLYSSSLAPNPLKVLIVNKQKGIDLDVIDVGPEQRGMLLSLGGTKPGIDHALDTWIDRCAQRDSMDALKQVAAMLQRPLLCPESRRPP